jgi:hypothetical protein
MLRKIIWFSLSTCLFATLGNVKATEVSNADAEGCSMMRTTELISRNDFTIVDKQVVSLDIGKFFYHDGEYCVPTNETYVIGRSLVRNYPRILLKIDGHTLKAKVHESQGQAILLLFYSAGGNQHILEAYNFNNGEMIRLNGAPLASNIRSINVDGDIFTVKNQVISTDGKRFIKVDSYQYKNNVFKSITKK